MLLRTPSILAVLAVLIISATASAAMITVTGSTPMVTSPPYRMADYGQADWVLFTSFTGHSYDEKAGASAISVGGTGLTSGNGSLFTYDDGQWLTGIQTRTASYQYNGWADVDVPQGVGRITVWLGCRGSGTSTFTATLAGQQSSGSITQPTMYQIDYSADAPGRVQIRLQYGTNMNVGMYAVALAVPEPTTLAMLGLGLMIWRRR